MADITALQELTHLPRPDSTVRAPVIQKQTPQVPRDLSDISRESARTALQGLSKASESALMAAIESRADHAPVPEARIARARAMAGYLEAYATKLLLSNGGENAEASQAKAERVKQYFLSHDERLGMTPLERIAQTYEYLDLEAIPNERKPGEDAVLNHMRFVTERAFDQHMDNPEQFVSHGFDHTLSVTEYTKQIMTASPTILEGMTARYGISKGEAQFMLEQVAYFHDLGYVTLNGRAKAAHSIAGAEIASSWEVRGLFDSIITSSTTDRVLLAHDFRDAVLFHNADKVERHFGVKIETTHGIFLTNVGDVIDVISTIGKTDQGASVLGESLTIYVTSQDMVDTLRGELENAVQDMELSLGHRPTIPNIVLVEGSFNGRVVSKDNRLGLEFSQVDGRSSPMHTVIRGADNLDISNTRFSEIQKHPAFRQIYQEFGDGGINAQVLDDLESLGSSPNSHEITRAAKTLLLKRLEDLPTHVQEAYAIKFQTVESIIEAQRAWKGYVIDQILASPENASIGDDIIDKIRSVGLAQDTRSLRHFGGCEPIQKVRFEQNNTTLLPQVVVSVDKGRFEQLQELWVTEEIGDLEGKTHAVRVPVAEYQLWRAKQALGSLSIDGKKIDIIVVDQDGHAIDLRLDQQTREAQERTGLF